MHRLGYVPGKTSVRQAWRCLIKLLKALAAAKPSNSVPPESKRVRLKIESGSK
jgi:hypothetical protein